MNLMKSLGFSERENNAEKAGMTTNAFFNDNYPRAEKETRIYNLIILDESGSMQTIREQAFSGVNETIRSIRQAQTEHPEDNQMLCLVSFSSWGEKYVRVRTDCEKIEQVQDLAWEQYHPTGGTPLFDAMGISISSLRELVREGDHVLVTVITDGLENASREYSAKAIKSIVSLLREKDWVFVYIGANQDAVEVAREMNINNAMEYAATPEGYTHMVNEENAHRMSFFKRCYEGLMNAGENFFDDDEDGQ